MPKPLSFRPTAAEDVETILAMERAPGNRPYVRQWTREQHLDAIGDDNTAHMIVCAQTGDILGYVILIGLTDPNQSIEFKRIVIDKKGNGIGRQVVQHVKRSAFEEYGAHRLWLEVMPHNQRAYSLYQSEGFVLEGTHRECLKQGDEFVSLDVMSMLAHEYEKER